MGEGEGLREVEAECGKEEGVGVDEGEGFGEEGSWEGRERRGKEGERVEGRRGRWGRRGHRGRGGSFG